MSAKIYIIVLNWNGKTDTLECLKSLRAITYDNYQVLMVDNGSEDDSVTTVRQAFPEVEILETGKNLGFAGGNNKGIKYALEKGCDYAYLLNNDTTVEPNCLKTLVDTMEADLKIGLVSSKIFYHSEPDILWFAGGKNNWMKNSGGHLGLNQKDAPEFNHQKEVEFLTGCSLLISRALLEKIGVLAEDYFLYYEDVDYSMRAQNTGYKTVYVPTSIIYHKVSRSTKPGSPSYIYYHTRNRLVCAVRNGSLPIKIINYLFSFFLATKETVKFLFFPDKREWAGAVLRGVRDFWLGRMGKA